MTVLPVTVVTSIEMVRRCEGWAALALGPAEWGGSGAHLNTTTRFRRYVGEAGDRPMIYDYTEPRIQANVPVHGQIAVHGAQIRYYSGDQLVFDHTDPDPYDSGWFAFRTVASHFLLQNFTVWRLPAA